MIITILETPVSIALLHNLDMTGEHGAQVSSPSPAGDLPAKALLHKPNNLSLIPKTHQRKMRKLTPQSCILTFTPMLVTFTRTIEGARLSKSLKTSMHKSCEL